MKSLGGAFGDMVSEGCVVALALQMPGAGCRGMLCRDWVVGHSSQRASAIAVPRVGG